MTEHIEITVPNDGSKCCAALAEQFSTLFTQLSNQLTTFEKNMSTQIDAIKTDINKKITAANNKAAQALDLALALQTKLNSISDEMFELKRKCNGLVDENKRLSEKCVAHESYSRRKNLIIRGIPESADETEEQCSKLVKDFIVNKMSVNKKSADDMIFAQCHRLGQKVKKGNTINRPVIIRFHDFNDRKLVWSQRFNINDSSLSISEDYASAISYKRNILYPIVKKAKQLPTYKKNIS